MNEKNEKNGNEEKKSTEKFEPAKLDKVELSKEERKGVAGGGCTPKNYLGCPGDLPGLEWLTHLCHVDGICFAADQCFVDQCFADQCCADDGCCEDPCTNIACVYDAG